MLTIIGLASNKQNCFDCCYKCKGLCDNLVSFFIPRARIAIYCAIVPDVVARQYLTFKIYKFAFQTLLL